MNRHLLILLFTAQCVFSTQVPSEVQTAITGALSGNWIFHGLELQRQGLLIVGRYPRVTSDFHAFLSLGQKPYSGGWRN